MARSVTVQLSDAQAERLERFARDRNADIAEAGMRLIDEALRGAEHPVIEFRDSAVGRQAMCADQASLPGKSRCWHAIVRAMQP